MCFDLFWTTSGEKWMCANSKSHRQHRLLEWLCVSGIPSWRQIAPWLQFQWKGIQLECINIAIGNTNNHVTLKWWIFLWPKARFHYEDSATRTAKLTVLGVIKSAGRAGVTHFSTSTFRWTDEVDELLNSTQKTQGQLCLGPGSQLQPSLCFCVVEPNVEPCDGSEPVQFAIELKPSWVECIELVHVFNESDLVLNKGLSAFWVPTRIYGSSRHFWGTHKLWEELQISSSYCLSC